MAQDRKSRSKRSGDRSHRERPAPEAKRQNREPARNGRRRERDEDGDQPVLAFGDHFPAFMRRAVTLPPLRKAEAA